MAYRTIYQITAEPVSEDCFISKDDFIEHWFTGEIADSVSDEVDRLEEIKNLKEYLEGNKVAVFKDESFTLLKGGKECYFTNAFKIFLEAAQKGSCVSLEEFSNSMKYGGVAYEMGNSFCNKTGDYVSSDNLGMIPFDEFIRRTEYGKQYFISGILSYHY